MLLQELDKFDDEKFKKAEIEDLNTSIDRYLKQKQNLSGRSKEKLICLISLNVPQLQI